MTDIAQISGFNLSFALTQPPFNGTQTKLPISQALSFSNVKNILIKEGSYTPNEDYEWLWQNIPANEAPNFIFVQAPQPINISMTCRGTLVVNAVPVNKLFLFMLPPGSPIAIDNVYIEGRSPQSLAPMAQGQPAQFFCLMAQATF